jgi:hypothetical protein
MIRASHWAKELRSEATSDGQKDLIQMPFIPGPKLSAFQTTGVLLPKLATPWADGFMGDVDAACAQQLLYVAEAQAAAYRGVR